MHFYIIFLKNGRELMILSSLILITALTLTQTLQATENYIATIINNSGMTYELLRASPSPTTCDNGIPVKCSQDLEKIMQIKPGNNILPKIILVSDATFILTPTMPLAFEDGKQVKISEAFIPNATIIFSFGQKTCSYHRGTSVQFNNNTKNASVTFVPSASHPDKKVLPLTNKNSEVNLIINPDYSIEENSIATTEPVSPRKPRKVRNRFTANGAKR